MSTEEARKLVTLGLQRRREEKEAEAREAKLEEYEKEMISCCNDNAAGAKAMREADEVARYSQQQMAAYRREQREQMIREWERDNTAYSAVRRYAFACLVLMLVTVWTPVPWWAAVALLAGSAVCLGAYIFRLYFPVEGVEKK